MKEILAKSNGITMLSHCTDVNIVSEKIVNIILSSPNNVIKKILSISSILHDIGKSTEEFQTKSLLNKNSKNKFRHNEIGWAFLYRYLNVELDILDYILDAVYWHHGISNEMGKHNHFDILESIPESDIETMKNVLVNLLGEEYLLSIPRDENNFNGKKTPNYYYVENENNFTEKSIIIRTCLISADIIASQINNRGIDINKYIEKENNFVIDKCPSHYDLNRFNEQIEIANDANKNKTSIIKGPTGKGKTLIGLICSSLSNKKLLWVCPRNDVAKNMYNEILKHFKDLNITNVKVELYLTGEVKKTNYPLQSTDGFTSDIIVTNIDNFLKPTIDSRHAERLFLINTADVVFDEYQELISEASLFAAFINIMRTRHRFSNCRTLLLSATPNIIHKLWDSIDNKTLILPNINQHYKAVHDKKYEFKIIEKLPEVNTKSNLIYFNSISFAQECKNRYQCENLIHSDFQDEDKDKKFEKLIFDYGKESERTLDKPNIVGTPIIQSSLDISFANVYISVMSPESFIQLLGRCNRFGDYHTIPKVVLFKLDEKTSRSENTMKNILYSRNLSDLWFDYMKQHNGKELTLDDFYIIYNEYNRANERVIVGYLRQMFNESINSLIKIYPYKFPDKNKSEILTAGSNKLRCFGDEIFVISKIHNSDEWTSPFSERTYKKPINIFFNEVGNPLRRILGVMKKLRDKNDERFEYNSILDIKNIITLDEIREFGKKSNTPYIRFDKVYHPEYGLIYENKLIRF